ncbi:hypothetical protein NT6N_11970 [Oceaniferula spumae]|uniref:N-acetyltransferase domain-containing protein n=1 Tax=Oceaniferula spumae TaxID=2979115 RepID=A0AAT9FJP8_9BACT
MKIRRATQDDNEAICQLMESVSMGQSIELVFERGPDYFLGAAIQSEQVEVYVLVDGDVVAGVFSVGARRVYLNGEIKNVRYLCDLRLHENSRSGLQLARGYRYIHDHVIAGEEVMQTLILKDNRYAIKMLTSGRAGLPEYHPCGEYLTWFIPKQKLRSNLQNVSVRYATPEDVSEMTRYYHRVACGKQFAPAIDFALIGTDEHFAGLEIGDFLVAEKAGEIVGMCALWDQSAIRRVRIKAYHSLILRWGRRFINLFSKIVLPPAGETIQAVYLYAFSFTRSDVGRGLLAAALDKMSKDQLLLAGMDSSDSDGSVFDSVTARKEKGFHYLVGYGEVNAPSGTFIFEVARV